MAGRYLGFFDLNKLNELINKGIKTNNNDINVKKGRGMGERGRKNLDKKENKGVFFGWLFKKKLKSPEDEGERGEMNREHLERNVELLEDDKAKKVENCAEKGGPLAEGVI